MSNELNKIQVRKPCPADWEEMTGNDRMRYCEDCKKHVYNLSKMSRREAEALIATRRGNLCARIVRQPDGTILTEEITSRIHQGIRRASPVASAVVTAILTISSSAVAQQPVRMGKLVPTVTKEAGDKKPTSGPQTKGGIASIAGTVADSSGALIAAASVKLTNKQTNNELTMQTSEEGQYRFTQIGAGSYSLKVEAPGFASAKIETVTVQQGEERSLYVTMNVVAMGEIVDVPKMPLRELYTQSKMIVFARVGKSVKLRTEGKAQLMKTRLEVSSTLKGARHEQAISVYQWLYEEKEIYVSGDTLLLFLNRRREEADEEADEGYVAVDTRSSIKKLSEADLQVYQQRIEELETIMGNEKQDRKYIVEWLVRCAEHPSTRWEGVVELTPGIDSTTEDENNAEGKDSSEKAFGALLTSSQKERLSEALFNTRTVTQKDREFIELVSHWYDDRLVPFLIEQLRRSVDAEEIAAGEASSAEARQNRIEMLRRFISLAESKMKK